MGSETLLIVSKYINHGWVDEKKSKNLLKYICDMYMNANRKNNSTDVLMCVFLARIQKSR